MPEITPAQSLARLLVVGIICSVAAWGFQFLPPNEYQPSRPIYTGCWLAAAVVGYVVLRSRSAFARSVAFMLIWIFVGVFLITLVM